MAPLCCIQILTASGDLDLYCNCNLSDCFGAILNETSMDQSDQSANHKYGHMVSFLSGVSLVALLLSIGILQSFPQLACSRTRIHFNLFISMAAKSCFLLIFDLIASSSSSSVATGIPCSIVLLLLHYLELATIIWVSIEGKVTMTHNHD